MDPIFIEIIDQIQYIKRQLYKTHKPEIIDGTQIYVESHINNAENVEIRSKEYDQLMRQQKKIIYKKDIQAQKHVENAMKELHEKEKEDEMKKKLLPKIQTNKTNRNDECKLNENIVELQKPWNKLSSNLKIHCVLKFVDAMKLLYSEDKINQLRFLLISSVSQKKLSKITDVDYDVDTGKIIKIPRLIYRNDTFELSNNDEINCVGLCEPITDVPKKIISKKITLIKKN